MGYQLPTSTGEFAEFLNHQHGDDGRILVGPCCVMDIFGPSWQGKFQVSYLHLPSAWLPKIEASVQHIL